MDTESKLGIFTMGWISPNSTNVFHRLLKPTVFLVALVPFGLLVWGGLNDTLGANPVETITLETGTWGLNFILITLAVSPWRRITHWNSIMRLRRMLGLFGFFYLCLHFTTYLWLDQIFDLTDIISDIVDRPYIAIGFTGFTMLIPLAVTSTNAMVKRLGGRNWRRVHRLAYFAAAAGVAHFLWLVKADLREPLIYLAVLVILMALRAPPVIRFLQSWTQKISPTTTSSFSESR